jgi:wyosine [tRNA(Phe)-imidazoG37] synthetase (radical SAM superfamily)
LVPFKTCSYDCIYCQLGRTTCKTVEPKEWVPIDAVLDELKRKLTCRPDYITFSGSGEPTLHSRLGEIIQLIRAMTEVPVAVLTNGSLLWRKEVRAAVALADVVLPSLDAPDPKRFKFINRPHPEITFARLVEGLEAFRREFSGQYWLEVMLLGGYTSLPAQVRQLANWARRIRPDKVQLNTAVRPPAEEYAMVVPPERLAQLARMFELPTEVVAEHRGRRVSAQVQASGEAILALLLRRPCTVEDIAHGLGMKPSEAVKSLADMEVQGKVLSRWRGLECFYHATTSRSTPGPGSCRKKPRRTPGRALSS